MFLRLLFVSATVLADSCILPGQYESTNCYCVAPAQVNTVDCGGAARAGDYIIEQYPSTSQVFFCTSDVIPFQEPGYYVCASSPSPTFRVGPSQYISVNLTGTCCRRGTTTSPTPLPSPSPTPYPSPIPTPYPSPMPTPFPTPATQAPTPYPSSAPTPIMPIVSTTTTFTTEIATLLEFSTAQSCFSHSNSCHECVLSQSDCKFCGSVCVGKSSECSAVVNDCLTSTIDTTPNVELLHSTLSPAAVSSSTTTTNIQTMGTSLSSSSPASSSSGDSVNAESGIFNVLPVGVWIGIGALLFVICVIIVSVTVWKQRLMANRKLVASNNSQVIGGEYASFASTFDSSASSIVGQNEYHAPPSSTLDDRYNAEYHAPPHVSDVS